MIYTFVVVGCGHIGKRHAEMIRRHPECELVGMVDINLSIHDSLKSEYKVPVVDTLSQLYQAGIKSDITVIATPNASHAMLACEALKAGSHVVIEKPMALKSTDAEQVIEEAKKQNKRIFCVMQNRYSPPSVWLKSVVTSGILGEIYMVQVNCFWNRDHRYYQASSWKGKKDLDGGTLYTQFSHFVDMMYWLFGEVVNIHSRFNNFNHITLTEFEDSGNIYFDFVTGCSGQFNYSTAVYNKNLESSMTIIAENGTIKVGGQYMEKVEYCDICNYIMPELPATNPANDYGLYKGSAANHHYIIENVVEVLKGHQEIHTTAEDGKKVVEMIEKFYKADF